MPQIEAPKAFRALESTDLCVFKPSERSQKCSDKRFGLFSVDLSRFEAVSEGPDL